MTTLRKLTPDEVKENTLIYIRKLEQAVEKGEIIVLDMVDKDTPQNGLSMFPYRTFSINYLLSDKR